MVYRVLGEDAENTAWLWFLEFVSTYDDDRFDSFPGLVRKYLNFKFVRLMQQQGYQWDKETLADSSCRTNPTDGEDDYNLQRVLNSLALRQELKRLSPMQKDILQRYFGWEQSQREIARLCNYSVRGVGYQKDLAIKLIRDKFYH